MSKTSLDKTALPFDAHEAILSKDEGGRVSGAIKGRDICCPEPSNYS